MDGKSPHLPPQIEVPACAQHMIEQRQFTPPYAFRMFQGSRAKVEPLRH
jgi:hypothetical protein